MRDRELPGGAPAGGRGGPREGNVSKILRMLPGYRWDGVPDLPYKVTGGEPDGKTDGATGGRSRDVKRRPLIGNGGESPRFHLRYFEVGPGDATTLERHEHEHVVVGFRGVGEVRLGEETHPVRFGDVVYVSPNEKHQFRCDGGEPFGFLCIVNAERDRPVDLSGESTCSI